jgi:hypothetical protein
MRPKDIVVSNFCVLVPESERRSQKSVWRIVTLAMHNAFLAR